MQWFPKVLLGVSKVLERSLNSMSSSLSSTGSPTPMQWSPRSPKGVPKVLLGVP